jgi:hypothetical protein
VRRSEIRALSVRFHFSGPSRSRSAHFGLHRLVRLPLWVTACVLGSACSRPDGDILYQPFGPADHLTDGTSGSSGLLEDAGEPTDPLRDGGQGGTGGSGQEPPSDSGTETDAAPPGDGDAGELGDAALTPESDAG